MSAPVSSSGASTGWLFVCRTCVRDEVVRPGQQRRGEALALAIQSRAEVNRVPVRIVECLNGCPSPCNAALRARGKFTYRFSGLIEEDVPDLVRLAERYLTRANGQLASDELPPRLAGKVSVKTPPMAAICGPQGSGYSD